MDKPYLIEQIGRAAYQRACTQARNAAPAMGTRTQPQSYHSPLPDWIDKMIWEQADGLTTAQRLRLSVSMYRDLPCYGLVLGLMRRYQGLDRVHQKLYWFEVRRMLSPGDPAWSGPIEYHLALDWFERNDDGATIWQTLRRAANPALLRSLLRSSGPAAWSLKMALYRELLADPAWHEAIYASVLASYGGVYGQIDRVEALTVLQHVVLPHRDDAEWRSLLSVLGHGDRYTNGFGVHAFHAPQQDDEGSGDQAHHG